VEAEYVDTAIEKEHERELAPDPLRMQGCRKPAPNYLYRQGAKEAEHLNAPALDPCGYHFMSPPFGPPSILLCEACAVTNGVWW
jgi:hypothetical protein